MKRLFLFLILSSATFAQPAINTAVVGTQSNLLVRVPSPNQIVQVLGDSVAGDTGGGLWRWDATSTLPAATNVIVHPSYATGRWLALTNRAFHSDAFVTSLNVLGIPTGPNMGASLSMQTMLSTTATNIGSITINEPYGVWQWQPTNALPATALRVTNSSGPTGRFVMVSRPVRVEHFGAVGDATGALGVGTDDTTAVQAAVNWSSDAIELLMFSADKIYRATSDIIVPSNAYLEGETINTTLLKDYNGNKPSGVLRTTNAILPPWSAPLTIYTTNITVKKLTFQIAPGRTGSIVYMDGFSGLDMSDIRIIGNTNHADWGMNVRGDNTKLTRFDVDTRGRIFQDGINILGGTNGVLSDSIINSGDDAIIVGSLWNQTVAGWTINNCVLRTTHGNCIRVIQDTNTVFYPGGPITARTERITFNNIVGLGGQFRNGMVFFQEGWTNWQTAVSPGAIRDIKISDSIFYGGELANHDLVNPWGILIQGTRNVTLDNVTVSNAIRSPIRGLGTYGLTLNEVTTYPSQLTNANWTALDFKDGYHEALSVLGGRYYVRTNQNGLYFDNTVGLSVTGARIEGFGLNGIVVDGYSTNIAITANQFVAGVTNANGVALGLTNDVISTVGNVFSGALPYNAEISGDANGTRWMHLNLNQGLRIRNDELRELLELNRGGLEASWLIQGSRLLNVVNQGIFMVSNANNTTNAHVGGFAGLSYATTNGAAGGVQVYTDDDEIRMYYGGGTQSQHPATSHIWLTATNAYSGTNMFRPMILTQDGLLIWPDNPTLTGVSTGLVFQINSDLLSVPYPTVTQADMFNSPAKFLSAGGYNTDYNRLMIHDGSHFQGASPGGPGRVTHFSSGSGSLQRSDYMTFITGTTNQTLTLLNPGTNRGLEQFFWKVNSGGVVNLVTDGTFSINGTTNAFAFSGVNTGARIYSDGTNWYGNLMSPRQLTPLENALQVTGGTTIAEPVIAGFMSPNTLTLTDAEARYTAVWIPEAKTITGVRFFLRTSGIVTPTATETNQIALYSWSAGTLTQVAVSANNTNLFGGTVNTYISEPFTTPYVAQPGLYYTALIANWSAAATAPVVQAFSMGNANLATVPGGTSRLNGFSSALNQLPATANAVTMGGSASVPIMAVY